MKIIRQNRPDFLVELAEANTGDYALEDILVMYDETCNSIILPPQVSIKGNPTIYLQCISNVVFVTMLKLSGGDYFPVSITIDPSGKIVESPIFNNQDGISKMDSIKPIAGGAWYALADGFKNL